MVVHRKGRSTYQRFSPYLCGVVYGLLLAGWTYEQVADHVVKEDGTHPVQQSIASVAQRAADGGGLQWDGKSTSTGVGKPRSTSNALDKAIVKLVFKKRGSTVVTAKYVRKTLKAARKVALRTIQRRINEAGLLWLRRRRKAIVPAQHKVSRMDWAAWVLGCTSITLARWAFTDGTTFYLARTPTELASQRRAALGPFVWRMADGSDALYEDCIGPSAYHKTQGNKIRVWGLLVAGMLFITILPDGETMNRWWYAWVINNRFPGWLKQALGRKANKGAFLVQDHERCLWSAEPMAAMRAQNITLLENYPKCSQDLNPIEQAWRELRARLACTEPQGFETRDAFILRLRAAVTWLNKHRADLFEELCTSQKEWAQEVLDQDGGRTGH